MKSTVIENINIREDYKELYLEQKRQNKYLKQMIEGLQQENKRQERESERQMKRVKECVVGLLNS